VIPDIQTRPIAHLASGDTLSLQLYRFVGDRPGKKVYLQSNLHGAEVSGNVVLRELIALLCDLDSSQLQGEIWIVPNCNPFAANQRSHHFSSGRYNPYTGHDWNRIFWDYENHAAAHPQDCSIATFAEQHRDDSPDQLIESFRQQIRRTFDTIADTFHTPHGLPLEQRYRYHLQDLCLDADYVIDCHSSSNLAVNYLYCFHDRQPSADAFLLKYGILMQDYDGDAFDEAFCKPWLALERELTKLDRTIVFDVEAWTLEVGSGMDADPDAIYRGLRGIKNYLVTKGVLDLPKFPLVQSLSHRTQLFERSQLVNYYAPRGGTLSQRPLIGAIVPAGQQLYQLVTFNRDGNTPETIEVSTPRRGIVFDVARNCSLNEGEYVLGVMEYAEPD
jgi:predicted deacylase